MKNYLSKLFTLIFILVSYAGFAQNESVASLSGVQATPKDGTEFGIHGGYFFSQGDLAINPGFGGGLHFRKALDYLFSLRLEGFYGQANGSTIDKDGNSIGHTAIFDNPNNPARIYSYSTTYISGGLQGVMSLNNLRWDSGLRKINTYFFAGASATHVTTALTAEDGSGLTAEDVYLAGRKVGNVVGAVDGGVGIGIKFSPKVNMAFEYKASTVFGKRSDLLDAFNDESKMRDIANYANIRLNFNLTKKGKLSEPLYWVNPMEVIIEDVAALKKRPELDLTDSDDDGVIDMLDQDNETPEGVVVDAKGVPVDSDSDGVPDYKDAERFSDGNVAVNGEGVSERGERSKEFITRDEVTEMINNNNTVNNVESGNFAGWFLPSINFNEDSYKVRAVDYSKLSSIATVLNKNPNLKVVVKGYTDKTAGPSYNEVLSYKRANAAIDHIVEKYGVDRSRFILQYGGEEEALVPVDGSSFANRRVTFTVAESSDTEMAAPSGAGSSNYKGKKGEGY
jgi:OOP family OmpA-OmpF porin